MSPPTISIDQHGPVRQNTICHIIQRPEGQPEQLSIEVKREVKPPNLWNSGNNLPCFSEPPECENASSVVGIQCSLIDDKTQGCGVATSTVLADIEACKMNKPLPSRCPPGLPSTLELAEPTLDIVDPTVEVAGWTLQVAGPTLGTVATLEVADSTVQVADSTLEVAEPTWEVADSTAEVANSTVEVADPTLQVADLTLDVAGLTLELAEPTPEVANPNVEVTDPTIEVADPTTEVADSALEVAFRTIEVTVPTVEVAVPTIEVAVQTIEVADPALEVAEPTLEVPDPAPEVTGAASTGAPLEAVHPTLAVAEVEELPDVLVDLTGEKIACQNCRLRKFSGYHNPFYNVQILGNYSNLEFAFKDTRTTQTELYMYVEHLTSTCKFLCYPAGVEHGYAPISIDVNGSAICTSFRAPPFHFHWQRFVLPANLLRARNVVRIKGDADMMTNYWIHSVRIVTPQSEALHLQTNPLFPSGCLPAPSTENVDSIEDDEDDKDDEDDEDEEEEEEEEVEDKIEQIRSASGPLRL